MEFAVTVQGEFARRHPGFTYRRPVSQPLDMWSLDPERLNYATEYPRSVNPPNAVQVLKTVDLADCRVSFSAENGDGLATVSVYMLPNAYTAENSVRKVYECQVAHAFTLRHKYVDEVLKLAFSRT